MCSIAHAASFPRQSNRSACHPTEPIPTGMANGRCGATAVLAANPERLLSVRLRDLRRDAWQRTDAPIADLAMAAAQLGGRRPLRLG
jgi:hypothetical protein